MTVFYAKGLSHARIVALLDIFEIDTNTFATVLELCKGGDLDKHLKEHQVCLHQSPANCHCCMHGINSFVMLQASCWYVAGSCNMLSAIPWTTRCRPIASGRHLLS